SALRRSQQQGLIAPEKTTRSTGGFYCVVAPGTLAIRLFNCVNCCGRRFGLRMCHELFYGL
ncbi:hypothetical protein, partial [Lacticaseibacillus sp. 53-4]